MPMIPRRPPNTPASLRRNNFVAIVGDSIAAGAGTQSNTRFFELLCSAAGARPSFNAGVGGETISQVAQRIDAQVISRTPTGLEPVWPRPGVCIVECGTNDANAEASLTTMQSGYLGIIQSLLGAQIEPVIATIPPKGTSGANSTQRQRTSQFNAYLHALADSYGLALIDVYGALVDPADGLYLTDYHIDQIHPSWLGVRTIATSCASVLAQVAGRSRPFFDQSTSRTVAANIVANPQFLGDANADGVADSWARSVSGGTVSTSLVADGSTGRNRQRLVVTSDPAYATVEQGLAAGTWSVGDELEVSCRISTADMESGGGLFFIRLEFTGGSTTIWNLYNYFGGDVSNVTLSGRCVIPSGTTLVLFRFGWIDGTGTFDLAEPQVINRTVLGLP